VLPAWNVDHHDSSKVVISDPSQQAEFAITHLAMDCASAQPLMRRRAAANAHLISESSKRVAQREAPAYEYLDTMAAAHETRILLDREADCYEVRCRYLQRPGVTQLQSDLETMLATLEFSPDGPTLES
jgi:hypothetical protein